MALDVTTEFSCIIGELFVVHEGSHRSAATGNLRRELIYLGDRRFKSRKRCSGLGDRPIEFGPELWRYLSLDALQLRCKSIEGERDGCEIAPRTSSKLSALAPKV